MPPVLQKELALIAQTKDTTLSHTALRLSSPLMPSAISQRSLVVKTTVRIPSTFLRRHRSTYDIHELAPSTDLAHRCGSPVKTCAL